MMVTFLLALLLVPVALGLLLYITMLLFGAFNVSIGGLIERSRFARYAARAQRADQLLQSGNTQDALQTIQAAFYFPVVRKPDLVSTVANHHTALLSRLLTLTSTTQSGTVRLLSLAKTDRLLTERSALYRQRGAASGQRQGEIHAQLHANSRALEEAVEHLIAEIQAVQQTTVYH